MIALKRVEPMIGFRPTTIEMAADVEDGDVEMVRAGTASDAGFVYFEESAVSEQSKRGRAQDRARVAGGQKHETTYAAKKTGTFPAAVRDAVKAVGNSRGKVEKRLGEGKAS